MPAPGAFLDLVSVDWKSAARDKEHYWRDAKRLLGASHGLEVADELRRFAQAQHPGWPEESERRSDHAAHLRLASDLDRISPRRRPAPG